MISFLLVISLVLISGQSINVAASSMVDTAGLQQTSVYMSSQAKLAFVEDVGEKYVADLAKGKIKTYSQEQANSLIEEATFATGSERERIAEELSQYGVYLFNTASSSTSGNMRSDISGIRMTAPNVFYTMSTSSWTITCGGYWATSDWDEGTGINIGDEDGFGVGFTNTSGTYNALVTGSYAYITNQSDNNRVSTYNRSDGNGRYGFGFRLQDRRNGYNDYTGYKWYGSCIYNSNFSSYSGIATAYYIHTYETAHISSITFNVSAQDAGISVGIQNKQYAFKGFSNDVYF